MLEGESLHNLLICLLVPYLIYFLVKYLDTSHYPNTGGFVEGTASLGIRVDERMSID